MSVTDVIETVSKDTGTSKSEVLPYLEPFMVSGSITPVVDAGSKHLWPKLTENAQFLPTATIEAIETFIVVHHELSDNCSYLLRAVERKLKREVSEFSSSSDSWSSNPDNFSRGEEDYYDRFLDLLASRARFYGNANDMNSADVISILSFADLSKAYYWFGTPLLRYKMTVSKIFGIVSPDVLSLGLRALTNLRNLDAHFLPSFRESIDRAFSAKPEKVMLNSWITGKCNLGKYYGKLCFLVYITTDFPGSGVQTARREIKALLQRMPKMTVNYLGIPSGWLNEPLWVNI
jgi:hypothetical protein